jgi:selenocysteine lyase/cysteine desulfurase
LLFVDAIQGIGAFPLDVGRTSIDFLAADGHKWQLGPEGAGFAYLRRDRLPHLRTVGVGWNSVEQGSDFDRIELTLRNEARRYEGGSQNMAGLIGWGANLELLESLGIENVASSILEFTDAACERLTKLGAVVASPREGDERSGIVSFELPERDSVKVRKHCAQQGVALACRSGRLRISPHAYNNDQDLEQLVAALSTA